MSEEKEHPVGPPSAEARFRLTLAEHERLLRNAIAANCPSSSGVNVEDVMQETLIRIWRTVSSEKEIRNVPSYLYRVAASAAIDAIRQIKSRREEPLELSAGSHSCKANEWTPSQTADTRADPERLAEAAALEGAVKRAVENLPSNRRRAVGLYLQGFTLFEIGQLCRWSEAKTRNLVYRGLEEIRQELTSRGFRVARR